MTRTKTVMNADPSSALVTVHWLAEHLDDPDLRVLDGSWYLPMQARDPEAEFLSGHIPGARRFDIDRISDPDNPLPHMLPGEADFEAAVNELGIGAADTVVIYDGIGLFSAPRVWWMFRVFGHDRVHVLAGGLPAWKEHAGKLESGPEAAREATSQPPFRARRRDDLVCLKEDMARMRTDGSLAILDARAPGRFEGREPELRPGVRQGHIPGSLNLPYSEIVSADGANFAPTETIAARLRARNVDMRRPIVTTCGSGVSACILALGLFEMGKPDVAVYDGSWTEWGSDPALPVKTGPASAKS